MFSIGPVYIVLDKELTHALIHHSETVPNSKKLQTTIENVAIKGGPTDLGMKLLQKY